MYFLGGKVDDVRGPAQPELTVKQQLVNAMEEVLLGFESHSLGPSKIGQDHVQ